MIVSKGLVTAIIPARYASTRLPGKPLVDLCGKPMIQRVYEQVRQAKLVGSIVVATDHEDIVRAVHSFGGTSILTPSDLKSGSDRIAFAAKELPHAEIIVNVQGDEPLISPGMIDDCIRPLIESAEILVSTPVKQIASGEELVNPNVVKAVLDCHGNAIYFSRSPIPYFRDVAEPGKWPEYQRYFKHLGLYVFRRDFLFRFASWGTGVLEKTEHLEQLRILEHGFKIKAVVTASESIHVDTPEDAERVAELIRQEGKDIK